MLPRVIMHSEISLDGHIDGYEPDLGLYYGLASRFEADMILFGSNTVLKAAEDYPPEEATDFVKPALDPHDKTPFWAVVDSRGILRNLHVFRRTEYCKDIIVLASEATPQSYLDYLKQRDYDFIVAGMDHVDYRRALEGLYERYDCRVIRTDTGPVLNNILLEQGLVDEISLLIAPALVGNGHSQIFASLKLAAPMELRLIDTETVENGFLWLRYRVLK